MTIVSIGELVFGVVLIAANLWDAFETIVLPRRVTRRWRLARLFSSATWRAWAWVACRMPGGIALNDSILGLYGPLAVLGLVVLWAAGIVLGFALVEVAFGMQVNAPEGTNAGFLTALYVSGTTFFTVGLGDVTPLPGPTRVITVFESATGFSFLALIIGYIPAIFSGFVQREVSIAVLDARAGSPPTALALLSRHARWTSGEPLAAFLREWETWTADLLGGYLSYPLLAHFRSQHEGQSWLAALTVILDACALLIVGIGNDRHAAEAEQARFTFAIARHAVGDLAQIFDAIPRPNRPDRLPQSELMRLRALLADDGLKLRAGASADDQLRRLRELYEPYADALSARLLLAMPPWIPAPDAVDDWETTAWQYDPVPVRAAMNADV